MFSEHIDNLRSNGISHFTSEGIRSQLALSESAAKSGLCRLKKENKIVSPIQGLYIIVPPDARKYGSIQAREMIPIIMQHLNADYYVGLLSAGLFFGATHQKPAYFQVITNKRIKHSLEFGRIHIDIIYRDSLDNLPTVEWPVSTGKLKIATPELIALDVFRYHRKAAGISHIATVFSELTPNIDADKLISLAEQENLVCHIQRIGFMLERIDVMEDEEKKEQIIEKLATYIANSNRPYVSLVPYISRTGQPRCKRWKIIENTDFESDL